MPELIGMPDHSWDQLKQHFFPSPGELLVYESLPFIAYAVDQNTVFLWYNAKCRDVFGLSEIPDGKTRILDFYNTKKDREKFLGDLKEVDRGEWVEHWLDFNLQGKYTHFHDYTKAVYSAADEMVGVLSLMMPATKEERFQKLLERLPIGIFRFLEADDGLDYANEKFVQMHGYKNLEEIKNEAVGKFIAKKEDAQQMIETIRATGNLESRFVEHFRKDKSVFWGAINAQAIHNNSGEYLGVEGTIMDESMGGFYSELFNIASIGLFRVEIKDKGAHIIVHCNDAFAENLGFSSQRELIGKDIRSLHPSVQGFEDYYSNIVEKDQRGEVYGPSPLHLPDAKGSIRDYQVFPRLVRDSTGNIIGRVGLHLDVTEEIKLQKRMLEIRSDIGKVLHAYSTTLVMASTNFDTVLHAFTAGKGDYFEGNMFQEGVALEQADQSVRAVRSTAQRLRQDLEQGNSQHGVFDEVARLTALLHEVSAMEMTNLYTAQNYEAATRMNELLSEHSFLKNQPKGKLRPLRQALDDLIRNTSIIFLHRGLEGVLEMEAPVQTLRGYLIDGVKPKEEMSNLDIYAVLFDVVKGFSTYANSRGIEIKCHLREIQNVYLRGYESELRRAFTNLLHNAIKYSWTRKTGNTPFVEVSARKDLSRLTITFVNRGVGITPKEIEEGKIFEFGYRGEKSTVRRRPGTGIGLYDSKNVIESHQGILSIESWPVSGDPDTDIPNQPYLTTVLCRIPLNTTE